MLKSFTSLFSQDTSDEVSISIITLARGLLCSTCHSGRVLLMRAPVSYPHLRSCFLRKLLVPAMRGEGVFRNRTRSEVYCGVEEYHLWKEKEGRHLCRETARVQCCPWLYQPREELWSKACSLGESCIELNICLVNLAHGCPEKNMASTATALLYPRLRSHQTNDLGLKTVTDPEGMSAGSQLTACLTACQKVCSWRGIWAAHLHTHRKNHEHPQLKETLKNLCFPLIIRFAISLRTSMKQTKNLTLQSSETINLIAWHFRGVKIRKTHTEQMRVMVLTLLFVNLSERKCSSVLLTPWVFGTGV